MAHQEISKILNRIFEQITQQTLNRKLGTGVLLPLPKPKKTQGPVKNLRLMTLLEAIRKILPKIFMNRTEDNINRYRMSTQMDHCQNTNSRDNIIGPLLTTYFNHALQHAIQSCPSTLETKILNGLKE